MPTTDDSNTTRIARVRQTVISIGVSKAGNSVSSSTYTSRAQGNVPIKVKNSSGISVINLPPNTGGLPILLSLTYVGSNYTACGDDIERQSMTMTITATFNRPIISAATESVGDFIVNGNTATLVIPNGPTQRCTNDIDNEFPVVFTVDGIYTVTGTLLIPANT